LALESETDDEEKRRQEWRRLGRDLLIVAILFGILLGGLFSYTRTWPPMVVIDSSSMQHGVESSIGVIDTGDLILVQAVSSRADITTYVEGRATAYATYGDFGDVIVFRDPDEPESPVPIIHRPIAFVHWNASAGGYDVPDLALLPSTDWSALDAAGRPTTNPFGLSAFVLHRAGWKQDLSIAFDLNRILVRASEDGFLTMGDNNAYTTLTKSDLWVVPLPTILGRARGEIPWFGLLKLTLFPQQSGCCEAWGSTDPVRGAPANSWAALDVSLVLLFGTPILLATIDFYLDRHPDVRRRLRSRWDRFRRRIRSEKGPSPEEALRERDESPGEAKTNEPGNEKEGT